MPAPVTTRFAHEGSESVVAAFRSIEQAALRAANAEGRAARVRTSSARQATQSAQQSATASEASAKKTASAEESLAKKQAANRASFMRAIEADAKKKKKIDDEIAASAKKTAKTLADLKKQQTRRATSSRLGGHQNSNSTGIEGLSKKEAVSMLFGSSSAGMASLGGIGLAIGGLLAFKGALELGAHAMGQFAGFVLTDVIRPAMAARKQAGQLHNTGYGSSAAAAFGDMGAFAAAHGVTRAAAGSALAAAYDTTRDTGRAKNVAGVALGMSRAYGVEDVEGLVNSLAKMRAQLGDLTDNEFATFADMLAKQSKTGGLSVQTQVRLNDSILETAQRFTKSNGGHSAANIGAISGLVGLSALSTGDATHSMAGFASVVEAARTHRVGTDVNGNVADVRALIPAMLAKFGTTERQQRAGNLDQAAIDFLKPFAEKMASGGKDGLVAQIAGATTPVAGRNLIGGDEGKIAQTTSERFAAAVERLKEKFLVLEPTVEHFMNALIANEPTIDELIDSLVPLGVAMGDLAAFLIGNVNPGIEILSGLFDLLASAVRVALLPFTIIPAVLAGFVGGVLKLVSKIPGMGGGDVEKTADFLLSAGKAGSYGALEQAFTGMDKVAKGVANLKTDTGARATLGAYAPGERRSGPVAAVAPLGGSLGWAYGGSVPTATGGGPHAAAPATPGLDALDKKLGMLAKALPSDPKRFVPLGASDRMVGAF